jgi:hypothetical protein
VADRALNRLQVAQRLVRPAGLVPVTWKAPTAPCLKVNTDGSVRDGLAACGAIFQDYTGSFLRGFSCRLSIPSALHSKLLAIIFVIEQVHQRGWSLVWVKTLLQNRLLV